MQNLGALYALMPALQRLYPREEDRKTAQLRHLELFNSHPYMASPILGAIINLEHEYKQGRGSLDAVSAFKRNAMSGFAALGDALFWNTLRPLSAVLALIFAYRGYLWAPLLLLGTYNLVHLFVRIRGYEVGLRCGVGLISEIQRWKIPEYVRWLRNVIPLLLGVVLFQAVSAMDASVVPGYWLLFLPVVLIFYFFLKRNVSPATILLGIFAVSLGVSLVMEIL